MAKLIIIRASQNSGKTTTCGIVYSELLKISEVKHSFGGLEVECNSLKYDKETGDLLDFTAIVTLNGKSVGIISAGDVAINLEKEIIKFIGKDIDIIICCARSRNVNGSSYRMLIDNFSANHQILKEIWAVFSPHIADKEISKAQSVSNIIKIVKENI